ncbi:MAG: hypothetical protein VX938_05065, partial [Myxococcota bacterium]|nr:hypothetical protein [Myxococcota bacterium]
GEFSDPDLQLKFSVGGFVAQGSDGVPAIYTAGRFVDRATRLWARFGDGHRLDVRVRPGADPWDRTVVELIPVIPAALVGRPALQWAAHKEPLAGMAGWVIETVPGLTPGAAPGRVLVDTIIGNPVEPPLGHLNYVALTRAEGLPVLDETGAVLCVVFRPSPVHEGLSLCAPGESGGAPPTPKRTPLEITP